MQKMSATEGLTLERLHPAGKQTVAGMVVKGWIERHLDVHFGARYCITRVGQMALEAKIPAKR